MCSRSLSLVTKMRASRSLSESRYLKVRRGVIEGDDLGEEGGELNGAVDGEDLGIIADVGKLIVVFWFSCSSRSERFSKLISREREE
ncbi:hypothetical protein GYH30_002117 [Glycine max]|nr:hypothetical protein GYH30_002117 [Glycine max]